MSDKIIGVDAGGSQTTVLAIYCPRQGVSLRQQFVTRVMVEAGYDVISKPVSRKMCGANPVHVVVDEWPRIEAGVEL